MVLVVDPVSTGTETFPLRAGLPGPGSQPGLSVLGGTGYPRVIYGTQGWTGTSVSGPCDPGPLVSVPSTWSQVRTEPTLG